MAWICTAGPVSTQCELARFEASDGLPGDGLGSFVAVSGNRAVVAANNDDEAGQDSGAVFVFEKTGSAWVQTAKLTPSDGAAFDRFGTSVAIDGDRIVVGTPQDDDGGFDSGSAYVFEYDGSNWVQVAKLMGFDVFFGDFYGINVGVDGNRIIVGACQLVQFQTFGTGNGKVYVYTGGGATWTLEQLLTASDPQAGDRFGAGAAIDGTRIIVGAENEDQGGTDAGAGYVFDLVGGVWTETQKLLGSDAGAGALVGIAVDVSGDRILLGAPLHKTGGIQPGAAYLFEYDGASWSEAGKLIAGSPLDQDRAGLSVALDGDLAFLGAHSMDGSAPGRVLSFVRSPSGTWAEDQSLVHVGGANGDSFGYGVAVEGSRVLASARAENMSGACYEFLWSPASVNTRNAGANPSSFSTQGTPVLGTNLVLDLDLAGTTGHSLGAIVGYASGLTLPLAGGQVILVNLTDPLGELLSQPLLPGPIATWSLAIPGDVSFCGFSLAVQGIHIGGVQPFALSNALDLVVGG